MRMPFWKPRKDPAEEQRERSRREAEMAARIRELV